jgi:hypothetical protein
MLDEEEYAEIAGLYTGAIQGLKRFREHSGADLKHPAVGEFFRPVRERYEQLTGLRETNENAILHHRLSLFGPPCKHCGKPLRTPKAKLCGNCMKPFDAA